ncbi:MAG: hypothetical protein DI539_28510 [Flavobacterium psychrophilum]|nr:MAG: hypothetical protein DI539_28510 [Flavobacterium psychrophilum]
MELKYEDGTSPQYNGNISGQAWGKATNLSNEFVYGYDRLNRLTNGESTGIVMSEKITYDVMGNILSLNRDGNGANAYTYNANKLISVDNITTVDYEYDLNGNAIVDGKMGFAITYNYLNLPVSASKTGASINYVYDATGRKLRKVYAGSTTTNTDYVAGIQYTNKAIELIQTEEGMIFKSGNDYIYRYDLKDHLSNVRYTFDVNNGTLRRLQEDNYYPFGMRKSTGSPIGLYNNYLYNGKELQNELEQYDYGARFYDPVIGRWNVKDQLSGILSSESPYSYAGNSPINFVDEGGLFRINAQFAKAYPTLTRMLKYYLPMLKNNKTVRDAFIKTTGVSNTEFDQMVSYGSGPWIVPTRYDLQNSSNFTNPAYQSGSHYKPEYDEENLYISGEKLAALERAFKQASISHNGKELGFQMFVTGLTIMHEAAHYGFFKKHGLKEAQKLDARGVEIGADFEGRAYSRFSYTSEGAAMDEHAMRKYYDANISSQSLRGLTLIAEKLGDFNWNIFFLKSVPLPLPNTGSGSGDPHIKPDSHYKY